MYIDSPYAAYEAIIGAVGDGTTGTSAELEAQMLRADRSKSINDILRPQIQDLLGRTDLSQSDRDRLDQHLTAIRDIEVQMVSTEFTVPDEDVETMRQIDPRPYDQDLREQSVRLFMDMMAFSAVADYSRIAVLKIGDRIDDHVYNINGQSFKFHDASHRAVNNGLELHHAVDRLMMGHYKYLLDVLSSYETPTGPLIDQGVAIWTNQCATGAHSFSNVPWILAGNAQGYLKQGEYITVGTGGMPGGVQDGKGGDGTVSGVNKMLNTILTTAGIPTEDFGDPSLPKGTLSALKN